MADDEFAYINGKAVATEDHIDELRSELEDLRSRVSELEERVED